MNETTSPKPFIFVLMPFASDFDDIYKLGIKSACQEAGAYCERVDEQIYTESILERVYNQIAKADIIIADMSERNPNVFYETGYAHALGKRVIHLTQKAEDIPFDLKHFPHIIYEKSIAGLREELVRRVKWLLENPKSSAESTIFNAEIYINDQDVRKRPTIYLLSDPTELKIELKYKFHNVGNRVYKFSDFQFGLISPNLIKKSAFMPPQENLILKSVQLNDEEQMWIMPFDGKIYPESWVSYKQALWYGDVQQSNTRLEMRLKVFSELSPLEFPFTIELKDRFT